MSSLPLAAALLAQEARVRQLSRHLEQTKKEVGQGEGLAASLQQQVRVLEGEASEREAHLAELEARLGHAHSTLKTQQEEAERRWVVGCHMTWTAPGVAIIMTWRSHDLDGSWGSFHVTWRSHDLDGSWGSFHVTWRSHDLDGSWDSYHVTWRSHDLDGSWGSYHVTWWLHDLDGSWGSYHVTWSVPAHDISCLSTHYRHVEQDRTVRQKEVCLQAAKEVRDSLALRRTSGYKCTVYHRPIGRGRWHWRGVFRKCRVTLRRRGRSFASWSGSMPTHCKRSL